MLTTTIDDTAIRYRFQPGKSDRRHLLVIFSGFRKKGTFDFQGSVLSKLASNILWIDDSFDGKYTYYLRHRGGKDLAPIVNKLIQSKLVELGLEDHQCTLAGFSKGGTASLYYATRFGYKNVVLTVPQFYIGRYISTAWQECIGSMTANGSESELKELDTILIDELEKSNREKNIYLFTSPADTQYKTEVLPNIPLLRRFDNFNLVTSETPLITRHNQVTKYNIPGILGILSLLAEGFSPIIGEVNNGVGDKIEFERPTEVSEIGKLHASVGSAFVRSGRLYVSGHALFENHVSNTWGSQRTSMNIIGSGSSMTVPLGQIADETVNEKFFSDPFVNHSHASFATVGHKGINITDLVDGKYQIGLTVEANSTEGSITKIAGSEIDNISVHNGRIYRLKRSDSEFTISVQSFGNVSNNHCYFEEVESRVDDNRLFVKGYLVPTGVDVDDWGSVRYFVELSETTTDQQIYFPIACDHKTDVASKTGNFFNGQSKAFYATKGYKGLDISAVPTGNYQIRVVGYAGLSLFASPKLNLTITIERSKRPVVDILGACVSRDVFNSRITPRWRNDFSLGGQAFQSSLISIMSSPQTVQDEDLADLKHHDLQNVKEDFEKKYVSELEVRKPDFIVVDFFTDSRFGVIGEEDEWVTDNDWKIGKSDFYSRLEGKRKLSMWNNEQEYIKEFRRACERFRDSVAEHTPNSRILVNSARCVTHHRQQGATKSFSKKFVGQQNKYWNRLESIFLSIVPSELVEVNFDDIQGDSNHPWGPGPVHYEREFYQELYRELLRKNKPILSTS